MGSLGKNIVKVRVDKGLKQKDLQKSSGISQRYLSALEHDKVDPRLSMVLKIAHALQVPVVSLLEGVGGSVDAL
jgi:transcriptional regulator with XRE-family HTH domain